MCCKSTSLINIKPMTIKKIRFKISRYKPGVIDTPRFYTYVVPANAHMSVLDGLEKIRLEQEPTLMYRHSCHHASCGTCACIINGTEQLACATKIWNLDSASVTLEPLNGFERIADLTVNFEAFFQEISPEWTYVRPAEVIRKTPENSNIGSHTRFENCIECGSCVSACPVAQDEGKFMGPAALAAIHREILKRPRKKEKLRKLAGGQRGLRWCQRALKCSRVCPAKVYPARHIANLGKALKQ